ncbi:nitrogen fixation protein NifZ [Halioxenophilus sp. WMMB6]|uniref:nitrogen fixation protein NifZ n=1 Tax=Halioxenophilus sp. WMMB6 TaxID=3073815 RepID=UPI00295EFE19|nr:nitrogen fixation protein NifZ [Halioxenophilus sp. WMMB6]
MPQYQLQPGDTILATRDIHNDGSFPDYEEDALLVKAGTRGVVINFGHLEENEDQEVFLVKFENAADGTELGPPIGCWPEDIEVIPDTLGH